MKRLTIVLLLLSIFPPMTTDIQVPAFPDMVVALNTTPGLVKLMIGLYGIGYAVGNLFYGPLSDRFGRYKVMLVGLILYVITTLLTYLASDIQWLLTARFFQAAAASVGPCMAYAMVRDTYDERDAAKYIALIAGAVGTSVTIAPIIGGYLVKYFQWRSTFLFLLVVGVIVLFLSACLAKETNKQLDPLATRVRHLARNYFEVMTHWRYVGFNLMAAFAFAAYYCYLTDSSLVIISELHYGVETYGWLIGMNAFGYALVAFISAKLAKYLNPRSFILFGLAVSLLGAACLFVLNVFFTVNIYTIVVPAFVVTASIPLVRAFGMAVGLSQLTRNIGIGSTLLGCTQYLFGGLAAVLLGLFPRPVSFYMSIVLFCLVILAVLSVFIAKPWRRGGARA